MSDTAQQSLLPFGEPRAVAPTIRERFERFLETNPDLWEQYLGLARQIKARGFKHYGSKSLCEVLRFHRALAGKDEAGYRVNNDFSSRLSRKLMEDFPEEFEGFFETRELKSE